MAQPSNVITRLKTTIPASLRDDGRVRELAKDLFDALSAATSDGDGITRQSYGEGENLALDIFAAKARELGLRTERDAAANLVVTLDGTQPELTAAADAILRESGSPYTLSGLISALDEVISQLIRAARHAIADITPPSHQDPASP